MGSLPSDTKLYVLIMYINRLVSDKVEQSFLLTACYIYHRHLPCKHARCSEVEYITSYHWYKSALPHSPLWPLAVSLRPKSR